MKSGKPALRRFLFLLSVLAALLAVCLLIVMKEFVEHAAFRNAVGTVCLLLLGPLLWFAIDFFVDAAINAGLGQIEIHLPKWAFILFTAILFVGAILLLADDFFESGWLR